MIKSLDKNKVISKDKQVFSPRTGNDDFWIEAYMPTNNKIVMGQESYTLVMGQQETMFPKSEISRILLVSMDKSKIILKTEGWIEINKPYADLKECILNGPERGLVLDLKKDTLFEKVSYQESSLDIFNDAALSALKKEGRSFNPKVEIYTFQDKTSEENRIKRVFNVKSVSKCEVSCNEKHCSFIELSNGENFRIDVPYKEFSKALEWAQHLPGNNKLDFKERTKIKAAI